MYSWKLPEGMQYRRLHLESRTARAVSAYSYWTNGNERCCPRNWICKISCESPFQRILHKMQPAGDSKSISIDDLGLWTLFCIHFSWTRFDMGIFVKVQPINDEANAHCKHEPPKMELKCKISWGIFFPKWWQFSNDGDGDDDVDGTQLTLPNIKLFVQHKIALVCMSVCVLTAQLE